MRVRGLLLPTWIDDKALRWIDTMVGPTRTLVHI
jgi:hypothetical protein